MMWTKNSSFTYPYTNIRTVKKPLEVAPIPKVVRIPLLSAKGKVGVSVVSVGQKISEGEIIGKSGDFGFYTSISGEVREIANQEIRLNATQIVDVPVVEIHFGGKIVNWEKNPIDYLNRSSEELKMQILSLGVENLNPTSCFSIEDILNFPKGAHLVVTAMEFSPMATFLEELLLQKQEALHKALEILKYILQPSQTTILVGSHLKNTYRHPHENVQYWDSSYPNGHEAMIVQRLSQSARTTRELLFEKGYVIVDTQTLLGIYDAIVFKKPFTEILITVEGKLARNPAHYSVRLGMPIKDFIEDVGVYEKPRKVVSGPVFFSDIIYNVETRFATPEMYSLLFLDEALYHYHHFEDCIQCNICHKHCPVGLFPNDLVSSYKDHNREELEKCLDCGICSYICPSRIALGYFLELQKKEKLRG